MYLCGVQGRVMFPPSQTCSLVDSARAGVGAASRQESSALHRQAAMALLGRPQPHLQSNSTVITTHKGCGVDCE